MESSALTYVEERNLFSSGQRILEELVRLNREKIKRNRNYRVCQGGNRYLFSTALRNLNLELDYFDFSIFCKAVYKDSIEGYVKRELRIFDKCEISEVRILVDGQFS